MNRELRKKGWKDMNQRLEASMPRDRNNRVIIWWFLGVAAFITPFVFWIYEEKNKDALQKEIVVESKQEIQSPRTSHKIEQNIDNIFLFRIIGFSLIAAALGILSAYFTAKLTNITSRELTKNLSNNILEAEYEYIEDMSDRILPVMTRDIRYLAHFINKFPPFIIATTTLVITLIRMMIIDLELTLYFLIILILQALLLVVIVPLIKKFTIKGLRYDNLVYQGLSNMVKGIKELTLNKEKRDGFIGKVVIKDLKMMTSFHIRSRVVGGISERIIDLLTFIFMGLFMYLCYFYIAIDFERFKIFLPIILFIVPFMGKISGFIRDSKEATAALDNINSLGISVSKRRITSSGAVPEPNTSLENIIEFKGVTYSYTTSQHERKLIFGPLNLKIAQGKTTFIIGGNGSGKTTFAKLFTGLYKPSDGRIIYNEDVEVTEKNLLSYRQLFSAYFADSFTFKHLYHVDDTLLDEKGTEFIDLLEMGEKVAIENKAFTTTKLSFGQRSRLALIANMLDDKPIYLFDEWAANQDPYFKAIFYQRILPYLKAVGKTILVISHDEKYFNHADIIIELKEGMVTE